MIFSCVRAPEEGFEPSTDDSNTSSKSRGGGVGFLHDWRRLNVAITRAKYAMWIVGHAGVLKQSVEWRELINDSKQRDAYVDRSNGVGVSGDGGHEAAAAASSGMSVASRQGALGGHRGKGTNSRHFGARSGGHEPSRARYSYSHVPAHDYGGRSEFGGSSRHPQFYGHPPRGAHYSHSAHYSGRGPQAPLGAGSLLHDLPIATPSRQGLPAPHAQPPPGHQRETGMQRDERRRAVPRDRAPGTQPRQGDDQREGQAGQAGVGDFFYGLPLARPKRPRK